MDTLEKPKTRKDTYSNQTNSELRKEKKLKEKDAYQERLLADKVDAREATQRFSGAVEEFKLNPKRLNKISPELIEHLSRAEESAVREKIESGQFPARYEAELDRMELGKKAELFIAVTNKKSAFDDTDFENFDQEIQKILSSYTLLSKANQLATASALKEKWNFHGDAELLREIIIINAKESGDIAHMKMFVKDETARAEFIKLIEQGEDYDKAFEEAIKKGSPELQKSFQSYSQQWQSPSISDVFPGEPTTIAGVKVEIPSSNNVVAAVAAYQQEGVRIDIPPNSNAGTIHIGDTVTREAAIYIVGNASKLFIYDQNADGGIRGPIDSKGAQEALFEIYIDDYFSRKFREYSTLDSEKDPTKVVDNKLLKMVRAFFPSSKLHKTTLDTRNRQLLDNLAYLCVTPDDKYPSISKKTGFFDRIVIDPLSSWAAETLLSESDFTKKQGTLSTFEKELETLSKRGSRPE